MACGALFRRRHQVAHRAVDSLVCHTAVGANLPSTLVQSSQRTVCQLGVVLHRYRLDCIYIYNACHLFPFLYVKLHRVLRNVTGYGRGVVATQYAPLTTVFNPSVTACHLPYILHYKTQGRRCSFVFDSFIFSRTYLNDRVLLVQNYILSRALFDTVLWLVYNLFPHLIRFRKLLPLTYMLVRILALNRVL